LIDAQQNRQLTNQPLVNATNPKSAGSQDTIPIYVQDRAHCSWCGKLEDAIAKIPNTTAQIINVNTLSQSEIDRLGIKSTPTAIIGNQKIVGDSDAQIASIAEATRPKAIPTVAPSIKPSSVDKGFTGTKDGHSFVDGVCQDCTVAQKTLSETELRDLGITPIEERNPWGSDASPGAGDFIGNAAKAVAGVGDAFNSLISPTISTNQATGEMSAGVNILGVAAIAATGGLGGLLSYLSAISNIKPPAGGAAAANGSGAPAYSPITGEPLNANGGAWNGGNGAAAPAAASPAASGPTITPVPASAPAAPAPSYYQSEGFYASGQIHSGGIIVAHGGLSGDEYPAILQTGERVLSRVQNDDFKSVLGKVASGQMNRHGSTIQFNPSVTVNGASGTPQEIADKVKDKILEAAGKLFQQMWESEFSATASGAYDIRQQ
jgi:hypothetical protein